MITRHESAHAISKSVKLGKWLGKYSWSKNGPSQFHFTLRVNVKSRTFTLTTNEWSE